ncbi:MAG TPA: ribosome recycling factor [Clostridia bacterium]|nr:ribosome recycling factor [Clostridia bacterium]
MVSDVLKDVESRMKKTVELFRKELATIRTGRASPALLDRIEVDYYGTPTPIKQLANISVPEPRLLVIQPWDKQSVSAIEKAILKSDLGITPQVSGTVIRLAIPPLTKERRQDLVKIVRKKAEEERVAIRNIRREGNEMIRELEKEKEISEDESAEGQEEIQELTDKYIAEIDASLAAKEKEIMEV